VNWRAWMYDKLTADAAVLALVPAQRIQAAGSLEARENVKPFIIFRLGSNVSELNDADAPHVTAQDAAVWVHDEPGSYKRIDTILEAVRAALVGQVPTAIAATWQGDSGELSDPEQGTIVRNSTYRLYGRAV
jgi:hypothetical protein